MRASATTVPRRIPKTSEKRVMRTVTQAPWSKKGRLSRIRPKSIRVR
jgi:hypothetical protein